MTFELKSLKGFRGHEGEPLYRSDITFSGKKVGNWEDDSWGGPMNYRFNSTADEANFVTFAKSYLINLKDFDNTPYDIQKMSDYDLITTTLFQMSLKEVEGLEIKKELKKGIVYYKKDATDPSGRAMYTWKVAYTENNVKKLKASEPNLLEIVNETMKMELVDDEVAALAAKNARMKKVCKSKTLFVLKEKDKEVEYVVNEPYSSKVANYLRNKYASILVEIVNERYV